MIFIGIKKATGELFELSFITSLNFQTIIGNIPQC